MTQAPVSVALFGASGMLAGEFVRLCEQHPRVRVEWLVSRDPAALAEAHPHLLHSAKCLSPEQAAAELNTFCSSSPRAALVFGFPHGESARQWPAMRRALERRAEKVLVVDLAADYRIADPEKYAKAYAHAHPDVPGLAPFVYGLPELLSDDIARATRVAAPGCFATALQLATIPAARAGALDPERPWILNGITGSSGSGNTPKSSTHHPFRNGNVWAYSLDGHRHEAELEQSLERFGMSAPIHFVAHSGPFSRGIHLTASLPLAKSVTTSQALSIYKEFFEGRPFVEVLDGDVPDLRRVVGSNRASIGLSVRRHVLTVLLTLDNMIKGGAGQAIQCLNLMCGFPETMGLPRMGLGVI
jgi:N-acetyl-gamma-glutamyl-phosphate reductase